MTVAVTLPLEAVERLLDVAGNAESSDDIGLSSDEWAALELIRREVEEVRKAASGGPAQ